MLNRASLFLLVGMLGAGGPTADAADAITPWVEGHNSKARLIAGTEARPGRPSKTVVGIEIVLADGWKTYWRNPGDAGGVPPFFDWTGSDNVGSVKVLYPVPARMKDASGVSVGYKKAVVLPVEVVAKDPAAPVAINLAMEYGVCREICIPAEAKLSLVLPTGALPMPAVLATALDLVPRRGGEVRPGDPQFKGGRADLAAAQPKLVFDVAAPGNGEVDAFIEAPDGIYLNLPIKRGAPANGVQTFEVDLATGVDVAELKGKTLLLTMSSAGGQSEAAWKIE